MSEADKGLIEGGRRIDNYIASSAGKGNDGVGKFEKQWKKKVIRKVMAKAVADGQYDHTGWCWMDDGSVA